MNVSISYSDMRKNLKKNFDTVCVDHNPLLVTRRNGSNIVVISEEDFRSLQETAYLSQSPYNLQRLLQALQRSGGLKLEDVKNELAL